MRTHISPQVSSPDCCKPETSDITSCLSLLIYVSKASQCIVDCHKFLVTEAISLSPVLPRQKTFLLGKNGFRYFSITHPLASSTEMSALKIWRYTLSPDSHCSTKEEPHRAKCWSLHPVFPLLLDRCYFEIQEPVLWISPGSFGKKKQWIARATMWSAGTSANRSRPTA